MINNLVNKEKCSFLTFLFVNFIFGIKYLSRISTDYLFITLAIISIYTIIWRYKKGVTAFLKKWHISIYLVLIGYFILSIIIFYLVPKETLNVDRWSVISSFWENYFNDQYVYYAKSFDNNYPGPMPFYFILALPFYLIGELGLFSFFGMLLFGLLIKKFNPIINYPSICFLFLASSFFYLWEITSRSNLFVNGILIMFSIIYFFRNYKTSKRPNLTFGIIIGLLLSTRNVYVIPYIITFVFALKFNIIDFKNVIKLGIIALITFCLTFVPFVWNHFEEFKIMNPFLIQSSALMPFKYTLIFIISAIGFGFFCKKEADIYFYSSLTLFLTILFYLGLVTFEHGLHKAIFESKADISYFILGIPFSIYHLFLNKEESIV
jgi:hypothetical protein